MDKFRFYRFTANHLRLSLSKFVITGFIWTHRFLFSGFLRNEKLAENDNPTSERTKMWISSYFGFYYACSTATATSTDRNRNNGKVFFLGKCIWGLNYLFVWYLCLLPFFLLRTISFSLSVLFYLSALLGTYFCNAYDGCCSRLIYGYAEIRYGIRPLRCFNAFQSISVIFNCWITIFFLLFSETITKYFV